jgi:alkaline phosphatase
MRHNKRVVAAAALAGLMAAGSVSAYAATQSATQSTAPEQGFTADRSAELAQQIKSSKPRNVILIIGDGMDDSMITAARNYELGAGGRFDGLDSLPFTGSMTTYGLKVGSGPDYPIAYVSDSAPTASGWSTGKKTVDGRISQGPSVAANVPGEDYETVLERYKAAGKLVGNITTSELTDATPAAAGSHINARACQGPQDMAACTSARKSAGGKGSIAEQLVDNEVDVLMGGGLNRYTQATDAGSTVRDYAQQEHGYRVLDDKTDLDAVTSLDEGPVLGLFAAGNMTPMYRPLVATPPPGAGSAATKCQEADRGNQPDLSTMTEKAIELLDNRKGFFLQAESAMIDKQEHGSDICGAIGDLRELDEAVQVALAFQEKKPDTLIIVTGDHAHSTQIVGGVTDGKQVATVQTADGDPMTVAYSTSEVGSDHTGAQIRVAASGPQGANVTGVIDQTDLFLTMLGRSPSRMAAPRR